MSKQVDVLAILNRVADSLDYAPAVDEMALAIETVRDLIEAADKYLDDSRLESRLNLIDALKAAQGPQA